MTRSHRSAARLLPVLALLGALCTSPTHAAETADALLRKGRNAEALAKADAFLQNHPRDAQMRFVKARAESALGRRAAALATLRELTQDYPALPEPLNNLAALQAADGQWDAALQSLEAALRLKPDYAVAYENLGDVYLALAQQRYARALVLDPDNAALRARAARLQPAPTPAAAAAPAPAASSSDTALPAESPSASPPAPVTDPTESGMEDPPSSAETTPVSPTSVAPSLLPELPAAASTPTR
ncbi:tetratricopeptide repeat protein [Xylophilus ampelinus]|uniref:Tfp pilus assembly protein PilF n=1 Tax=Xylophilus ampelinus TaxID=54067 RepID=A0A318SJ68_9BURK|nr:tetratricopeptide repeat protein [Xylophilus ampelinus]MCS4509656.1 tetratricopeptide repeat protein [Xylophilus ampelinus]PYE78859.1 Tfp pilus assembly protein PilF [Xylophilus ampelinus]